MGVVKISFGVIIIAGALYLMGFKDYIVSIINSLIASYAFNQVWKAANYGVDSVRRYSDTNPYLRQARDYLSEELESAFWLILRLDQDIKVVEDYVQIIQEHIEEQEVYANTTERKAFMKDIIDIKHCFEDSIDCYNFLKQQRDQLKHEADKSNILMWIIKHLQLFVLWLKQAKPLWDTCSSVMEIKKKYVVLTWPDTKSTNQHVPDPRREFTYTDDYYHVGLDAPVNEVIELLDLEMHKHKRRQFVAVVGQAGVGKTTLVRKAYDRVKGQFQLCAWVIVSQSHQQARILEDIVLQFKAETYVRNAASRLNLEHLEEHDDVRKAMDKLNVEQLAKILSDYLKDNLKQRYIVVLDDVWDTGLSMVINSALTSHAEGSRILMTSRDQFGIAENWKTNLGGDVFVHEPLSEANAMLLLCRKLYRKEECPEVADDILLSRILKFCPLLPLLIIAIAGLLCTKPRGKWKDLLNNLGSEFKIGYPDYDKTKRILLYSYHDLPYDLRCCFLYFGMLPEDHEIEVGRLIRIWVADGFLQEKRDFTPEKIAERHLDKLMERGLVTITNKRTSSLPSILELSERFAKVHDILFEIIRDKLEELYFGHLFSGGLPSATKGKPRRLSTYRICAPDLIPKSCCSFRSIMWLDSNSNNFRDCLKNITGIATKCVRVVHVEKSEIDEVPHEVGKLHNLRLLRLRIQRIDSVPKFICQLINLETLDMINNIEITLPEDIKRLIMLRHLIISSGFKVRPGVLKCFTKLQTLVGLALTNTGLVDELNYLRDLRTLHVSKLGTNQEGNTLIDLEQQGLTQRPSYWLEKLMLSGIKLPSWIRTLESLVAFSFDYGANVENPLEVLQHLPKLEILRIKIVSRNVQELDFGENDTFLELMLLVIWVQDSLSRVRGALPSLKKLYYQSSDNDLVDLGDLRDRVDLSFYHHLAE